MNKSQKNDIPVKLFASCLLVKGKTRSAICDIQRGAIELIPNSLYDLLMKYDGKCITQIKQDYNHQYDEIIEEYYEMLEEKEYIFYTQTPEFSLIWI